MVAARRNTSLNFKLQASSFKLSSVGVTAPGFAFGLSECPSASERCTLSLLRPEPEPLISQSIFCSLLRIFVRVRFVYAEVGFRWWQGCVVAHELLALEPGLMRLCEIIRRPGNLIPVRKSVSYDARHLYGGKIPRQNGSGESSLSPKALGFHREPFWPSVP